MQAPPTPSLSLVSSWTRPTLGSSRVRQHHSQTQGIKVSSMQICSNQPLPSLLDSNNFHFYLSPVERPARILLSLTTWITWRRRRTVFLQGIPWDNIADIWHALILMVWVWRFFVIPRRPFIIWGTVLKENLVYRQPKLRYTCMKMRGEKHFYRDSQWRTNIILQ